MKSRKQKAESRKGSEGAWDAIGRFPGYQPATSAPALGHRAFNGALMGFLWAVAAARNQILRAGWSAVGRMPCCVVRVAYPEGVLNG